MSFHLTIINPTIDKRWDEFVLQHPRGTIYHHSAWIEVLQATYGYTPFCIGLESMKARQLEGIIPFLLIKSKLTGNRLVSLPITSYCHPLLPETELEKVVSYAFAHHPDIDYLELKVCEDIELSTGMCENQSSHVTHILDLQGGLDAIMKSFHDSSVRRRIKKADRNSLTLKMGDTENDLWKFYELETGVRKKHGLPPQPYNFFRNMWRALKPRHFMLLPLVEYEGKVIAAAIILRFREKVYYEYAASDERFLSLCPNHKLLWDVIKLAHTEGARYFDFGRSSLTNQSLIAFKDRWGTKRYSLMYYYFPRAIRMNTEGGFGRRILRMANRHLPHAVLQLEGKVLYRHLG